MTEIEFTNRYDALDMEMPHPDTVCLGPCEGTGYVPVNKGEKDPELKRRWEDMERRFPNKSDTWHFVRCPVCEGTGKRRQGEEGI